MLDSLSDAQKARGGGLLLTGIGVWFLKMGLFDVLREAEMGTASIRTSGKALFVAPAFLLFGLLLVVTGAPGDGTTGIGRHFVRPADRKLTSFGWLLTAVAFAPGLGLYIWLKQRLQELGYE
ncbi:hypothetical protein [Chondromyces crocatus]|uniref:Uncharacterized protein n=1 Tax=Chondromyces crocatus TaxID=52 RepID=A0A0K1EKD7_CHOCO|nr:hypothetical protein [Chondromyces crocatus]AKT41330.1 uncharacterized protein CMC5_055290 [Chondromyces crocatus]